MYKEDFPEFKNILSEMIEFIIKNRGEEVISEKQQKNYQPDKSLDLESNSN